jgi:hypothetical protein
MKAWASSGCSLVSVTATGFSMRMVSSGTVYSSSWPFWLAKMA